MAVYLSKHLRATLQGAGVDLQQFLAQFTWWKADPQRINQSAFFGKDGSYAEPQLDGRGMILRHVHLLPIKDESAHERWLKVFKRRGEKTSDKALVYTTNDQGDHLLLCIFDEPGAHERARKDATTMRALYRLAISFIDGDLEECEFAA